MTGVNRKSGGTGKSFRSRQTPMARILPCFPSVDYFASVWLNGKKLGDHEGVSTRFSFDITSLVKPGQECVLAVPSRAA